MVTASGIILLSSCILPHRHEPRKIVGEGSPDGKVAGKEGLGVGSIVTGLLRWLATKMALKITHTEVSVIQIYVTSAFRVCYTLCWILRGFRLHEAMPHRRIHCYRF